MTTGSEAFITKLYLTVVYECDDQDSMAEFFRKSVTPIFIAEGMAVRAIKAEASTEAPQS